MDASHVCCTKGGFKRTLEVIISRTTTKTCLVYVRDKFIFPNLIPKFVVGNIKICIVKTHFSISEFLKIGFLENFQGV